MGSTKIKWSYATHSVTRRPSVLRDVVCKIEKGGPPPRPNDVILAEVIEINRHKRVELVEQRKSKLFPGDVLGLAYGHRYATRQWRGRVPGDMETCHMLSVGGVCGEVVDMAPHMGPPTILRPLGYLQDDNGLRVNLREYGICPAMDVGVRPAVVLVVGSSMDSGKTTAAFSTVYGLTRSGAKVAAAKLTGTACMKDLLLLSDAGATEVLDFSDAGHASTAKCGAAELSRIAASIITNFAAEHPDYIVLEIADGIVQDETRVLLEALRDMSCIDYVIYTCNDTMGIINGVQRLREGGMNVVAISGWVACSPLARDEAQAVTELPVLLPTDLQSPAITELFPLRKARMNGVIRPAFAGTPLLARTRSGERAVG